MATRRKKKMTANSKKSEPVASPKKILGESIKPVRSPLKSPLTNVDAPSFVSKSFYGSKSKKIQPFRSPLGSTSSGSSQASGFSIRKTRKFSNEDTENQASRLEKKKKSTKRKLKETNSANIRLTTPILKKQKIATTAETPQNVIKSSEKKFFRTKSPASCDRSLGSIVIRKGFNLKFVPRRLSGKAWDSKKTKVKKITKRKYPRLEVVKMKGVPLDTYMWESSGTSTNDESANLPTSNNKRRFEKKVVQKCSPIKIFEVNAISSDSDEVTFSEKSLTKIMKINDNDASRDPDEIGFSESSSDKIRKTNNVSCDSDESALTERSSNNNALSRESDKVAFIKSKFTKVPKPGRGQVIEQANLTVTNYKKCYIPLKKCDSYASAKTWSSNSSSSTPSGRGLKNLTDLCDLSTPSLSTLDSQDLFGFDALCNDESMHTPDIREHPIPSDDSVMSDSVSSLQKWSGNYDENSKYYSIFDNKKWKDIVDENGSPMSDRKSIGSSPRLSPKLHKRILDGPDQRIIDAGQKTLGAIQCNVCNMLYTRGDDDDESEHAKLHQAFLNALYFPGWKKERVVQEFPDDGGRVLMVLPSDQKYATSKVEEINQYMCKDLGFPGERVWSKPLSKVFLYVSDEKEVKGCVVAEPIVEAYHVIPEVADSSPAVSSSQSGRPWRCSTEATPSLVGINRLWVHSLHRGNGVATKLVDTVRHVFEHGVLIDKDKIAFSDPTSDGKRFAAKYTGNIDFLVYKYT